VCVSRLLRCLEIPKFERMHVSGYRVETVHQIWRYFGAKRHLATRTSTSLYIQSVCKGVRPQARCTPLRLEALQMRQRHSVECVLPCALKRYKCAKGTQCSELAHTPRGSKYMSTKKNSLYVMRLLRGWSQTSRVQKLPGLTLRGPVSCKLTITGR